jgi:HEPN domain-containing protein
MNVHPVEEWIKKAEDNYVSAVVLAKKRGRRVPDVICNQCQQATEKYLKEVLVRHGRDFPKTHDLTELEEIVALVEMDVRLVHDWLRLLNPYGVDVRYPGLQATDAEAKEAVKAMKEVRKFVRAKLGMKK